MSTAPSPDKPSPLAFEIRPALDVLRDALRDAGLPAAASLAAAKDFPRVSEELKARARAASQLEEALGGLMALKYPEGPLGDPAEYSDLKAKKKAASNLADLCRETAPKAMALIADAETRCAADPAIAAEGLVAAVSEILEG